LVIQYDFPNIPETYVHRIGRTGRAQASGVAISFCDHEERVYLKDIQKLIKQNIPVIEEHPFKVEEPLEKPSEKKNERSTHFKPKKWRPKNNNRNSQNKGKRNFSKNRNRK